MAWDDGDLVGKGEKTVVNCGQKLVGVATGEVSSTNGAGEKGVSGDQKGVVGKVKAAAALGVSGCVEDRTGESGDSDRAAVGEVVVGGGDLGGGDA